MSETSPKITLEIDLVTARLLRDVLHAQGEHQAAGAAIPVLGHDGSELLGAFLSDLDRKLGGPGRFV